MGSFSVPLSGLKAAQDQLQAVSNNLANSGTTGYKDSTLTFSGVFSLASLQNGSGDPIQTGSGVKTAASDIDFTEGNLNPTGASSNMALSGDGFFVTQNATGDTHYTRAGDFKTNASGQLITPSGDLLLGYPAVNGIVDNSGKLQPLQVGSGTSAAVPTSGFGIDANLDADAAVGDRASSTVAIFDSLGASHSLTVDYTKSGSGAWDYNISIPNKDLSTGGTGTTQIASGSLSFDSSGALVLAGNPPSTTIPVVVPPAGSGATFANGARSMSMNWDLTDAVGNTTITQTSTASATSKTTQNGSPSGSLKSYAVLSDGTIEGTFSSGQTLSLGQVAVASFANLQGLQSVGDGNYQASVASGSASVGVAGTSGRGTIVGGSVEQSNVNIATEFARLIVAQQAYSANAKAVTTFNQVSQATLAMVQ
jgi:flagellar hook protein FlgE